jgi:methionyl aminopeptidase
VNEEAAHGIPGEKVLGAGDMINIDVSAELDGFVADMGESFVLGEGMEVQHRICASVQASVRAALKKVRAGRSLNVIGRAVQHVADSAGYRIVENLGSHGVGRSIHEEPSYVPLNNPGEKRRLKKGMVLTIEPFLTTGTPWVNEEPDGWTLTVQPGELVAQYEHTLVVTDRDPVIITARR